MKTKKILTLHPQGKNGVNISLTMYNHVKGVILKVIGDDPEITFSDMAGKAQEVLVNEKFDGKPLWYIATVKLDLEARELILRIPKTSPHKLRLKH